MTFHEATPQRIPCFEANQDLVRTLGCNNVGILVKGCTPKPFKDVTPNGGSR